MNTVDTPLFVDVVLPLPLANLYTYSVPTEYLSVVAVGMRVMVPVQRKFYTGIIFSLRTEATEEYEVRPLFSVLDNEPLVLPMHLRFWQWIATYYQSKLGDVYKAALPSGLKLESETQVALSAVSIEGNYTRSEQLVLGILGESSSMAMKDLGKKAHLKNILPVVKSLIEQGAVVVNEQIVGAYKPKVEDFVRLSSAIQTEKDALVAMNSLQKAPKQAALFSSFLRMASPFSSETTASFIQKKTLLKEANLSAPILSALIQKGILEIYTKVVDRLSDSEVETVQSFDLNTYQQKAYEEINICFQEKDTVLLHGLTSSGKTEIYIHLMEDALKNNKQVLFLLPEIALTSQITARLRRVFGSKLGVYHSKFPDAERVEIWRNLLKDDGYQIIVGVRSSVFLPFKRLGLVIVDEEHESTYKQFDPAPRYHARNAAIVLASFFGAKTLLGSATPSIETYNNALLGKYGLVELFHRYKDIELPKVEVVDIKELKRKKRMRGIFSPLLLDKIKETLAAGEQVILFQNRRGYASFIECPDCGYVPRCKNCDVSLTVHKAFNALTCHYCGYTISLPQKCPNCGSENFQSKGYGTEKVEDELQQLFPDARIARMDLDTTRTRTAYERILLSFEDGNVDILIGTQMVTKGLDFRRVSLVGILNADNMLNFPDFRAHERAFQLMAQVSGRAGRSSRQGFVILQTSNPELLVIRQVIKVDYRDMFCVQMQEREAFKYPPYVRLIYIQLKHRDMQIVKKAADEMAERLRRIFNWRILGPDNPPVMRIQNFYIKRIVLKIEVTASSEEAKRLVKEVGDLLRSFDLYKSLQINMDVDPM